MKRLFCWLQNVVERHRAGIIPVLLSITIISTVYAVIQKKHANELQKLVDRHIIQQAAEIKESEFKRAKEEWDQFDLKIEIPDSADSTNTDNIQIKKTIEREEPSGLMPNKIR